MQIVQTNVKIGMSVSDIFEGIIKNKRQQTKF